MWGPGLLVPTVGFTPRPPYGRAPTLTEGPSAVVGNANVAYALAHPSSQIAICRYRLLLTDTCRWYKHNKPRQIQWHVLRK